MSKVTTKLQVTIPKRIATRYGITPGTEIEWQPAGDAIRVAPADHHAARGLSVEERLRLYDKATERQCRRDHGQPTQPRDWTRAGLYTRG
jgi:bifunctional DNA-binding transcriptional regulator/antitoxin component of YhaV-PrlF toxin-antitoxin module